MTRKIFMFLILTTLSLTIAAEFTVISFKPKPTDLAARRYEIIDVNGTPCALIKVQSDIKDLQFHSMLLEKVINKNNGEYWVYVQEGTRRLKVRKDGILPLDFSFPEKVNASSVYILVMKAKGETALDSDLLELTFKLNTEKTFIIQGSNTPLLVQGKISSYKLPPGEYNFRFYKPGYEELSRKINLSNSELVNINLKEGNSASDLNLPGSIMIKSEPQGAEIYLNGQKRNVTTPYQDELIAGEYSLRVSKEFYYTHNSSFTIEEGKHISLPVIRLKPKFAYFSVKTNPAEAEIYLDNILIGESPLELAKIESGRHKFKIMKDSYHPYEEEIYFDDGDKKLLNFELKQAYGGLIIESEPTGAEISLNSKKIGLTPYKTEKIPSGTYHLKLTKDLWADFEESIIINDAKNTIKVVQLNQNFGKLIIKAADSDIYIDGRKVGKNQHSASLTPGKHNIKATRLKHNAVERTVDLAIGKEQEIVLVPKAREGGLSIFSEPAVETEGAKIYINGKLLEKRTPAIFPYLIGDYQIKVVKDNYLPLVKNVIVKENEKQKITFKLQTYEGSLMSKRDFWRKQKWLALGSFAATTGTGVVCNYLGDLAYDDYKSATSRKDALDYKSKTDNCYSYRDISYSISVIPLGYFLYSWFKEADYNKRIANREKNFINGEFEEKNISPVTTNEEMELKIREDNKP